jgi:hypothetical protein
MTSKEPYSVIRKPANPEVSPVTRVETSVRLLVTIDRDRESAVIPKEIIDCISALRDWKKPSA